MPYTSRRTRRLPALAGALGLALAMAWGQGAFAQNAGDDEEEVPLDTKLFRQFMKDLGVQRDGDGQIEYRERAPLVVPPSRNLPPPHSATAGANNPAWPKDPDAERQKREAAAAKKKPRRTAAETEKEEGRALRRAELDAGRLPAGTPNTVSQSPEEGARPLRPVELGAKSIWTNMFGSDKPEAAPFTAEPPREKLTAPPPGYQTPSPNQPYGLAPRSREAGAKPSTVESRAVGQQ
jgi:hypothetical protein